MRALQGCLKNLIRCQSLLFALLFTIGCQSSQSFMPLTDNAPILPRKVSGTSDVELMTLQKNFNRQGVKVISIGQDYLVSIPAAALFTNQSPQLTWQSYEILNDVVSYLKQFRKVGVNVTGYSSRYLSVRREHALTLTRARAVADYLWGQGIDSRFVFTEGAGSDKPIVTFNQGGDRSPNARIEITFRDVIT